MPESNWGSRWWRPGCIGKKSDFSCKISNETVTRIETKPSNMEDCYIPLDIIKRLPVKPLIQFRSVCKPWKSLIDSSKFIYDHHHLLSNNNKTQSPHHLLVSYIDSERKYISVTDDGFPQHHKLISCWNSFSSTQSNKHHKLSTLTVPMSVKRFHKPTILGSDQGLFCLYQFYAGPRHCETEKAVIWNPSISKSVSIHVPNVILDVPHFETILGFGVCPSTMDPKLVKINHFCSFNGPETVTCIPWQVEVFTLSSGVWRNPYRNVPSMSTEFDSNGVVIDGFIYWLASRKPEWREMIISFDLTTEEFMEVYLPDSITTDDVDIALNISKLGESLVVLEHYYNVEEPFCDVWIMEHGVPKALFTKLFSINPPEASLRNVLGFSKSGEAIIQLTNDSQHRPGKDAKFDFVVYEPTSKHINHIGISAEKF